MSESEKDRIGEQLNPSNLNGRLTQGDIAACGQNMAALRKPTAKGGGAGIDPAPWVLHIQNSETMDSCKKTQLNAAFFTT